MMGAGKSSVGRALARRLNRALLDSDEMIEERAGRPIREIWIDDGEPAFRQLEAEVIADAIAAPTPSIVAAAGGVVLSETNRAVLKSGSAHVVWLLADVELLLDRVRNGCTGHCSTRIQRECFGPCTKNAPTCTRMWRTQSFPSIIDRSTMLLGLCCDAPGDCSSARPFL